MLADAFTRGVQNAFQKFGLALPQPATKALTPGHALPAPPQIPAAPLGNPSPFSALGKAAANVGMGASTATNGTGATRGDPPDVGRRQRSVIDRTFQQNDDFFASSSMPAPGGNVSP